MVDRTEEILTAGISPINSGISTRFVKGLCQSARVHLFQTDATPLKTMSTVFDGFQLVNLGLTKGLMLLCKFTLATSLQIADPRWGGQVVFFGGNKSGTVQIVRVLGICNFGSRERLACM